LKSQSGAHDRLANCFNSNPLPQKNAVAGIISLCIVVGISTYLELLGLRILNSELSISDVWSWPFITGALRTSAGAVFMGILFVLIGIIPRKTRVWAKSHLVQLWSAGAMLFLLIIVLLIFWAPW